jgi:integrase
MPGERYTTGSYRQAIGRGCDKADQREKGGRVCGNDERLIPRWHPHVLRHNAATRIERHFGKEAAQIVLGHSSPGVTEMYIDRDGSKAAEYMSRIG